MNDLYDCIIIGAGPGGLQAAIYLGRYNRKVLLLDRGGGRTLHARNIENFLTQRSISGKELIEKGKEQARSFGVEIKEGKTVTGVTKGNGGFTVSAGDEEYGSRFVIVNTGIYDDLPSIQNMGRFFGTSFFTCIDCDGHHLTGRKAAVIGNSVEAVRLAIAIKEMYTDSLSLVLEGYTPPKAFREMLDEEDILTCQAKPKEIMGEEEIEALVLDDGTTVECEKILSHYGYHLNDGFLSDLSLEKDRDGHYTTNRNYESSVKGLYIIGPLNTGEDQAIISAGEGATAAMDIGRRLLQL